MFFIDCKVYKFKEPKKDKLFSDLFDLVYLNDQDEIAVEGATLKAHLTPGHTKDHLAFFLNEEESLFSGDCILGEGSVVFEDLQTYLQSLYKILLLNPKKLYPGHGPVVDNPTNKVNDYINRRMEREKQILNVLDQNKCYMTSMQIVESIYKVVN